MIGQEVWSEARRLLRCGISAWLMTGTGASTDEKRCLDRVRFTNGPIQIFGQVGSHPLEVVFLEAMLPTMQLVQESSHAPFDLGNRSARPRHCRFHRANDIGVAG
jgi:hypothetical protein